MEVKMKKLLLIILLVPLATHSADFDLDDILHDIEALGQELESFAEGAEQAVNELFEPPHEVRHEQLQAERRQHRARLEAQQRERLRTAEQQEALQQRRRAQQSHRHRSHAPQYPLHLQDHHTQADLQEAFRLSEQEARRVQQQRTDRDAQEEADLQQALRASKLSARSKQIQRDIQERARVSALHRNATREAAKDRIADAGQQEKFQGGLDILDEQRSAAVDNYIASNFSGNDPFQATLNLLDDQETQLIEQYTTSPQEPIRAPSRASSEERFNEFVPIQEANLRVPSPASSVDDFVRISLPPSPVPSEESFDEWVPVSDEEFRASSPSPSVHSWQGDDEYNIDWGNLDGEE
jgi:hypothetical protein